MQKFFLFLSTIFLSLSATMRAQGNLELFGLRSWEAPRPEYTGKGWGGGMNLLTRPLSLTGEKSVHPFDVRFGGGVFVSGLGSRKFRNIPLEAPQTGNATVKFYNDIVGLNLFLRFEAPNLIGGNKTPYIDFLGGLRSLSSGMTVIPDFVQAGYENKTNSSLYSTGGLTHGIGIGMKYALSDKVGADCELIWNYSPHSGDLVNLKSATRESDGITYDLKVSPNSVFLLKVGFCFYTESSRGGWHSTNSHDPHTHSNTNVSHAAHGNSVHVGTSHGGGAHPAAK